jgi:hypothetical protein
MAPVPNGDGCNVVTILPAERTNAHKSSPLSGWRRTQGALQLTFPHSRALRSRQSISSSRGVSAVLMSRSSCPRLAGTLQRSSFPAPDPGGVDNQR